MSECEKIKLGRRTVGGLYETPNGLIFMAYRWVSDIYRANAKDISTAIRDETAMWAIEEWIAGKMRHDGVMTMGVIVRDTGDRYAAPTSAWFHISTSRMLNIRGRSGNFRGLYLAAMQRRQGKIPKLR